MALFNKKTEEPPEEKWPYNAMEKAPENADLLKPQPAFMSDIIKTTETVITKNVIINGTISGDGNVLVEGSVIGNIQLNGALTVAETGSVKGPIEVDVAEVLGNVEGDIVAKKRLRLASTGVIRGDIKALSLNIEDGGKLDGCCNMLVQEEESAPEPAVEELPAGIEISDR